MEIVVKNLVIRNRRFYFRYRLPVGYLPGRIREIKVSLHTSDLKRAVTACNLATDKVLTMIETGVARIMKLADMRRLIADYISSNLEDHARQLAGFGPICPATREEGGKMALNLIRHFEKGKETNTPDGLSLAVAQDLLKRTPHDESDFNLMVRETMMAQLFLARMQYDTIMGKRAISEYSQTIYDEIINGDYRSADRISQDDEVHTLAELTARYTAEKEVAWGPSMRDSMRDVFKIFLEYFSPADDIRTIKHRNLQNFRDDILLKLPARRSLNKAFKGLSLREMVERNTGDTLSRITVNSMLGRLEGFFIWCHDHEYIDRNPAAKLKVKAEESPRLPFTTEDLKKIIFHLRRDKLNAWAPHKFWIPLIALYSGARQNEICQMLTDNIVVVDGIPCFQITECEEDGLKLKTLSSKRIVPIHPVLLQLNLLGYVQSRARDNQKLKGKKQTRQLWPGLTYTERRGYADKFQKFFGRFKKAYITPDPQRVFHSLRHNVTNALKQMGVQERIASAIVGHSDRGKSITYDTYGQRYRPGILLEHLKQVTHDIDVFEILEVVPVPDEVIREQVAELPPLTMN